MINKIRGFLHRVQRRVKYLQATAQRYVGVIMLVGLFLVTAILPSTAEMVAENSLASGLPNTQNVVEQGFALYSAQRFGDAVKILQQENATYAASGDKLRQAMTLSNLSLAYQELGMWTEAQKAIAQSLLLLQKLNNSKQRAQILAQTLDIQGRWQLARGQTEDAINSWQQAADIYTQIGEKDKFTRNRINSAQAKQVLGLYPQARKILTEVQQSLTNQQDSLLKATGLRSLGDVLRVVGDLEESRRVLKHSLKVASSMRANQETAEALLSLANTARVQGDTQATIDFYQQAAAVSVLPSTRIQLLLNQFSFLLETKQWSAAVALSPQIQSEINKLPPSRMAVYARINFAQNLAKLKHNYTTDTPSWLDIAQLLAKAGELAQSLEDKRAESYAKGTLGWLYEQTGQFADAKNLTEKALFIAQSIEASDIGYQWEWQLGRLLKTKGDTKLAISYYSQAIKTLQSLRSDLVTINPEIQFSFRENVEPVYRELVALLLQAKGNTEPPPDNLKQARFVIESLQLAELDNFFRQACLTAKVSIDQVAEQDQTAAILYPIILPDRLEVILKLPGQKNLKHYATNVANLEVESTLSQLRENITQPHTLRMVQSLSGRVYDWLIRPTEADLAKSQVKTLVFVLDGALRNIPMASLSDGKQYLVEKYAIALSPSLQLFDPKPLPRKRLQALIAGLTEARFGFSTNSAVAQIIPDGTLPNNSSVKLEGNTFNITGGTQAGGNLFHSFREFSIPTGGTAFFNNAVDIQNIISRVTGGSISNIDGLIRANGTANLFLMNPNGIVFGKNASLNIGGSFIGTTANAIGFGNQGFFSASTGNTPELLTVNPSAFFLNQIATAPIQNNSVAPAGLDSSGLGAFGLRVPDGKSLLLVGGNVSLDGGGLYAFGGRVELGGVSGAGTVGLNFTGNNLSLSFPSGVQRADIFLSNAAKIDVTDKGQGSVTLGARNLDISGGSRIDAGIGKGLTADNSSTPGDITLNATGVVTVREDSRVTNMVAANATGNAGNINIQAGEITINNQAKYPDPKNPFPAALDTSIQGQGRPGNISLEANGSITLIGQDVSQQDLVISTSNDISQLGAGNISLKANGSIFLSNAAIYAPSGTGDGGNILLVGNNSVSLANNSSLFTASTQGVNSGNIIVQSVGSVSIANSLLASTGDYGGDIKIGGRSVSVTAGAEVSARSFNGQKSGNIEISAPDYVEISGKSPAPRPLNDRSQSIIYSSLLTTSEQGTIGKSGDIRINTGVLRVSDGAQLRAESAGGLRGGSIIVNANVVELTGGGQLLTTAFNGGDAGDIKLQVSDRITINGSNPSKVDLFNQIAGSKIRVELLYAREIAQGDGRTQARFVLGNDNPASGVFANTSVASTGKGGNIKIATGQLLVSDSAQVNVSSEGKGNAGNLEISSRFINLDNQAKLTAENTSGKGGNITLQDLDLLLMRRGSQISTTAGTALSGGDGGNITINAPEGFIVAVPNENSDITANAYTGSGGKVQINASGIFGTQFREKENPQTSDITASSQFGRNGSVEINTPDIDPNTGLINLPSEPVEPKVASGCTPGASQNQSKFVITGRGGLPLNPREAFNNNDTVRVDWVTLNPSSDKRHRQTVTKPTIPTPAPIVEATGWVINAKGEVLLIASAPNSTPHSSWQTPATCGTPKSAVEH